VLRALSASSINKTIDNLQWVLSIALEQGRIETNSAVGRRRRLKEHRLSTRHLDSPTQIEALLEAASKLDRDPRRPIGDRHPIIATFPFAGLRAHELGSLRWRDVDLDSARISVTRSKAPARLREISLFPVLAEVLRRHRSRSTPMNFGTLVFPTRSGGERSKDNLRERVLLPALAQADQLLEAREQSPLPRRRLCPPTGLNAYEKLDLRRRFSMELAGLERATSWVRCALAHENGRLGTYGFAGASGAAPSKDVNDICGDRKRYAAIRALLAKSARNEGGPVRRWRSTAQLGSSAPLLRPLA
jgi:integrase